MNEDSKTWLLTQLNIYKDYQKPGLYTGSCQFTNGIKMQMTINLDHEKAAKMISFLSNEIVESAKDLSNLIVNAMPVQLEQHKSEEA